MKGTREQRWDEAIAALTDDDRIDEWAHRKLDAYQRSFLPRHMHLAGEVRTLLARYLAAVAPREDT